MRFSIFTPSHRPHFLPRLEASLAKQTCQDFEWVVCINNCRESVELTLPQRRIVNLPDPSDKIGYIKYHTCMQCRGDILVEVDHDDEITPDCLDWLDRVFRTMDADFVYSDFCNVKDDGSEKIFGKEYGWEHRPFSYQGRKLTQHVAFPADPASFLKIWYAPNHVRAWRRDLYERIGGHNVELSILDDQELLCRTYLAGAKIVHVEKPFYIYHVHDQNTCYGEKNAEIQKKTLEYHDQFVYPIVEKWAEKFHLDKIDLCCGNNCAPGYIGVDSNRDMDAMYADLNGPWPFEDGSVGVFRAHDALEHLKDPIHVMKEAYRCLAPNGWFLTLTPSTDGRGAFQDPTHVSFWNSNSFWYYTKKEQAAYIGTPVKFQLARIKNFYPNKFCEDHNILYVKADLLKPGPRTPGLMEI